MKLRLMVIDDDEDVRRTLCENLEFDGFSVVAAANGEEGLALMSENRPALVIMDMIMPRRDGLQTIPLVCEKFPDVKIIAISGGGWAQNQDILSMARDLGAHAALAKPLDLALLGKMAKQMLGSDD